MTTLDRRTLLTLLSSTAFLEACRTIGAGQSSAIASASGPGSIVVRRRWDPEQDGDFKAKYIQAVTWLKANDAGTFPADDPRSFLSWKKLLLLHQRSCQHGNWWLLPWHRLYLLYFETACQVALQDPTFAVPYWDWTLNPSVPKEFYAEAAFQTKRDLPEGATIPDTKVGATIINSIISTSDFYTFHGRPVSQIFLGNSAGNLENVPHNEVHNTVGGLMGNVTDSPTDPLFWLHHANIDRLWSQWIAMHPAEIGAVVSGATTSLPVLPPNITKPTPGKGSTTTPVSGPGEPTIQDWATTDMILDTQAFLPGFNDPQFQIPPHPARDINLATFRPVKATMKAKDMILTEALGYTYDTATTSIINTAVIPAGTSVSAPRLPTNIVAGDVTASDGKIVAKIAFEGDARLILNKFKEQSDAKVGFAAVNIPIPTDAAVSREVSLNFFIVSNGGSTDRLDFYSNKSVSLPEFVGSLSFFGTHQHHTLPGQDPNITGTFVDITRLLRTRIAKGTLDSLALVAVAVNEHRGYVPASLFTSGAKSDLQLQFTLREKI